MLDFKKYDKYGQELLPGSICAYSRKDKVELVMYKGDAHGRTTKYGRFISNTGPVTLKFSSVVFAFDPMGERRNASPEITNLVKKYYEG